MKYSQQSRRHFLQGLGGSLMALPLLPSLLTSEAYAQAVDSQKFFVIITGDHGGTGFNKDWYPAPFIDSPNSALFSTSTLIPPGGQNGIPHIIRSARLSSLMSNGQGHDGGNVDNGQQRVSFVLGSFLNPYLSKINVLAGIDGGMIHYGHSRSVTGGSLFGLEAVKTWPTLDHYLANSAKFYSDRATISVPVLNRTPFYSWMENGVGYPETSGSLTGIYNALFSRYQNSGNAQVLAARARRTFLMDRVLEDFNRLVRGTSGYARRISSVDKQRLSQHGEHMFETQRKYTNLINSCSEVTMPTFGGYDGFWVPYFADPRFNRGSSDPQGDHNRAWDVLTSLLAAAFSCGATRLANLQGSNEFFLHSGDYHQDIAHQHTNSRSAQLTHNRNHRWQAEHIFAGVVKKLDAINIGNGQTLLDRGLVLYLHEAGHTTHDHYNLGCVTAGSANNFFNTGNFVDYRNLQNNGLLHDWNPSELIRPGVPLQRLSANILQAFGHVPADYRRRGRLGYGGDQDAPTYNGTRHNPQRHVPYPVEMVNSFDTKIPLITT